MSRRKPRTLRSDESELWRRIARTARPLHAKKPKKPLVADTEDVDPKATRTREEFQPSAFEIGSRSRSGTMFAPGPAPVAEPPLNMDSGAFRKLKRGKVRPQAKIDLHGMTADAAEAVLTGFIFRAQALGKRLVLVITGKGRPGTHDEPIPSRPGVLRRSLPVWLGRPPLSSVVQQWTEAHLRHGGSGAFYVYLRRPR